MDEDRSPVRRSAPAQGGTVEPANRAPVAIERFQMPNDSTGERYELRDPFAEVTYRANTLPEMIAKAEQLGSTRFVAVAEDGKRTSIQKVRWRMATWAAAPSGARAAPGSGSSARRGARGHERGPYAGGGQDARAARAS